MVAAIIAFVAFIIGAGLSWEIWQGIKKAEEPIESQEKAVEEKREELKVLYSELAKIPMNERDTKRKEIKNKLDELHTEGEKTSEKIEEQVKNYFKLISTIVGTFYLMILILIMGAEKGLGLFSWMMIWAIPIVVAFYILSSIKTVGADEKGLKLFFGGLPYQEAKRGPNFVPLRLVQLLTLPTTVKYLKFEEDEVMLTGPES